MTEAERKELKWLDDFRTDVAMAEHNDGSLFLPRKYSEGLIANIERLSAALATAKANFLELDKQLVQEMKRSAMYEAKLAASEARVEEMRRALQAIINDTEAGDDQTAYAIARAQLAE